ncbi:MAG: hypothetical protein ABGZ24_09700, partial [Fuerstiella sp.]
LRRPNAPRAKPLATKAEFGQEFGSGLEAVPKSGNRLVEEEFRSIVLANVFTLRLQIDVGGCNCHVVAVA